MSASAEAVQPGSQDYTEFLGHPKGLYVCFATELWERFSFYGMKYLLLLYLTKYHLFSDGAGLDVLGAYAGLVYALPVIGGLLADRYLGMRKAVLFGGILLSLGHLLMAYEGHQAIHYAAGTLLTDDLRLVDGSVIAAGTTLSEAITIQDTAALNVFYMALALIVAGVGFLKPNISTIVGKLYSKDDHRRDSGFTIFYMGINIGSWAATILCGWLGITYGWKYGFGLAGIGMVLGLFTFMWGQKFLYGHADPSNPEKLTEKVFGPVNREWLIYLVSIASLALIWWLVQSEPVVHTAQYILLTVAGAGLISYAFMKGTKEEMHQMIVLMVLILSTIVFWALFEQSAGSMTLYADRVTNQNFIDATLTSAEAWRFYAVGGAFVALVLVVAPWLFGKVNKNTDWRSSERNFLRGVVTFFSVVALSFAGWLASKGVYFGSLAEGVSESFSMGLNATQIGSLNAMFIMIFAIPFAALWTWLDKRGWEPNTPIKFGLGIAQAGLGFGMLVLGAQFPDASGKVALIWLVLAYLLHTTGELCLSPVGLSAVTKLAIPRVVGVAMGTWFLATALSETVATRIGKWAQVDTSGGEVQNIGEALATYTELFNFLMIFGVVAGVILIIISPLLRRGMHGVH
ncbi:MAG: peptide ABC transporter [Lysobacteraceae bacterium]|nr:MAG: peptide ABC transporter [Xanthomonadaceae bacterium]